MGGFHISMTFPGVILKVLKMLVLKTCLWNQLSLVCRACLFENFYDTPILKMLFNGTLVIRNLKYL